MVQGTGIPEERDGDLPIFRRVMSDGDDATAVEDAAALAALLAARARTVTVRVVAELIALGSAADGAAGRVALDPPGRMLLDGARCPVALAPRGFGAAGGHRLARIDVGIDGGREAAEALALAARLARAHAARVRMVAVAELDFDLGGAPRRVDPGERERLARHLEHAADDLAGVDFEADLREGLADQVLVGLAREADLLVLGSRAAYAGAGRVSLGRVAERVIQGSPSPTLVVPAP